MRMLGAFAVGKTSLVAQFVRSMFSEKYQTTVGVKIDKKSLKVGADDVNMMLWDLHGEDEFQKIRLSYLRGTSGYLLVADGTRAETLDLAIGIQQTVQQEVGDMPFILVLNKSDLVTQWALEQNTLDNLTAKRWEIIKSSAKTGEGVEEAFLSLAQRMLA
jgi:small GTP-binding protein